MKTFNEEDILKLNKFCHEIVTHPRRLEKQKCVREGSFIWCEDWEIIEILKYLFNEELYLSDPLPNRLKGNPLWSQQDIIKKAEALVAEHKTADKIIAVLKEKAKHGDT